MNRPQGEGSPLHSEDSAPEAGRELPAALSQLATPPIFVVGAHRSGTTWVYDLLTSHPQVSGVFESALFSRDLGIASLFHPTHWYDSKKRASDREFFGRSFRLRQLLTREQLVDDVRELTAGWLATSLEPETRFLVEKTPQHAEVIPLLSELFPGAAFVNVIRDGRDVAVSTLEAQRSWQGGGRVRRASVPMIAERWGRSIRAAREGAATSKARYTELRFEELHCNPCSISRIFEWCGVPVDPELVASIVAINEFSAHQTTGNDAFRRRGRVGDWRSALGLRARFEFDRAAGDLLRELGYESKRLWWLHPVRQAKEDTVV